MGFVVEMIKSYKHIGICIFCQKSEPEVTFRTRPHTIPQAMGGKQIGFDVCDECNHYFGTIDMNIQPHLAVETCVKEVLNVTKYLIDMSQAQHRGEELPILKSIYFSIYQKKSLIRFRRTFESTVSFTRTFTRCFKRGLYEMFLQEYHRQTKDGLNPQFDAIRRFARYNEGNLPVWHLQFNPGMGIHFSTDESKGLEIPMNDKVIADIRDYGMFPLLIRGFWFYLAVTPKANEMWMQYQKKKKKELTSGAIFRGVEWLEDIHQVDFTLRRFNE